jgi:GNAT superfamily N-acetyltransferase
LDRQGCHDLGRDAIRLARPNDADALLALQHRLDMQSTYMLLEPDERGDDPSRLRERLESKDAYGSFDLVAGDAETLVGWVEVDVLPYLRARHCGYLVMGVDAAAAGHGVGRALLAEAVARRPGGVTSGGSN